MAKSYRPHLDAGEGFVLSVAIPGRRPLVVSSWPYKPADEEERRTLEAHPRMTSAPYPKKNKDKEEA